jgi:hypothetical protein
LERRLQGEGGAEEKIIRVFLFLKISDIQPASFTDLRDRRQIKMTVEETAVNALPTQ